MRRRVPYPSPGRGRPGKTLVMFALLLPVLLGMVGLVIDCGLLIAAQRTAQNAADAAAMAAAMAKLSGQGDPQSVATTFMQSNAPSAATLTTFNSPPAAGPHAGDGRYYEVIVTCPVTALFMPVLSVAQDQFVRARAVAGREAVPAGEAIAALDPTAAPGLAVTWGANLVVDGRIAVNSMASPAASAGGGRVEAAAYRIAGGTVSGTFGPYPGTRGPLALNQPPGPDPLINLPTPATTASTANNTATPPGPSWSTLTLGSPSVQAGARAGSNPPTTSMTTGRCSSIPACINR